MKKHLLGLGVFLLCQSAGAEVLVLKGGYAIPDIQVLVNRGGIIQFKQEGSSKVWDLDQNYVEKVSEFQPMEKKVISPGQLDVYLKSLQQKQDMAKTLTISTPEEAAAVYMSNCKDPYLAMSCGMLLPSAGHAYAGDWPRGAFFLFTEALLIGAMFIPTDDPDTAAIRDWVGLGGMVLVKGIEIYDAVMTVDLYNRQLRQELKIEVAPVDTGLGLNLKLEF